MRVSVMSLVAFAAASVAATFDYPDFVPLQRRQAPGTPQYDCHASCGGVISASRTDNYCESANFTTGLEACLDCALEFDIWQYYGNSVTSAATGCGLDATPVPAPANSNSTETAETSASGTATSGSASETSGSSTSGSSEAPATTSASETSAAAETSSGTETGSAGPAQQTGNSASNNRILGGLAMVPIGAVVAGLI